MGFVLMVAVLTGAFGARIASDRAALTAVQLTVIGVLLVFLACRDLRRAAGQSEAAGAPDAVALTVLAATGAITAQLGIEGVTLACTAAACYGAASDLPAGRAAAVTATAIVAVQAGGVLFGFVLGAAIGWPMLLVSCAGLGRLRWHSQRRGDRLQSLVEQMRVAQERERRMAALEERHRIAREIHDVLAHSLSALGLQIEAARAVLLDAGDVTKAMRLLDRAQSLADDGLADSREAIGALRSDRPPLPEALAGLAESRAHARLRVDGTPHALNAAASVALIRVANEALANADRHAPDTAIELRLGYDADETTLRIANGAPGHAPANGSAGGYGLAGMRERVQLLGGSLTAGPVDGGWAVTARVPR